MLANVCVSRAISRETMYRRVVENTSFRRVSVRLVTFRRRHIVRVGLKNERSGPLRDCIKATRSLLETIERLRRRNTENGGPSFVVSIIRDFDR